MHSISEWQTDTIMPLFQRRKRNLDHNVVRLRELYASLLSIVEPSLEDDYDIITPTNENMNDNNNKDNDDTLNPSTLQSPARHSILENVPTHSRDERNVMRCIWYQLSAYNPKENIMIPPHSTPSPAVEQNEIDANNTVLLSKAREIESNVIELIRSIGETVIYGEKDNAFLSQYSSRHNNVAGSNNIMTQHQVFEYFCDKNILSLLVDILLARPFTGNRYAGVTWTAQVKAQILQTISIFVSNVSDTTSLYYLFSNNYMNRIITSMLPLDQWSDSALDEILPVYISFLKSMALQLANKPDLFQFFVCHPSECNSSTYISIHLPPVMPLFPLFHAAVHIAISSSKVASSDYFVKTTALNIILNIFQLKHPEISSIISKSHLEQQWLITHICEQLNQKYHSIFDIIMIVGNRISPWRQEALASEQGQLDELFQFITDLLWCSQSLDGIVSQRFCEGILSKVIMYPILDHILRFSPNSDTPSHRLETQAKYLGSLFFLSSFFQRVDYIPLLRMVVIAIFHPYTPQTNFSQDDIQNCKAEFYITPTLNAIAKHNITIVQDGIVPDDVLKEEHIPIHVDNTLTESEWMSSQASVAVVSNPFQKIMYQTLSGDFGDTAFALVAIVIQTTLSSTLMDLNMLQRLGMLRSLSCNASTPCLLEDSLTKYYSNLKNEPTYISGQYALNIAISITSFFITMQVNALIESFDPTFSDLTRAGSTSSPLFQSIVTAKQHFASYVKEFSQNQISSEFLPDLMERKIKELYSDVDRNTAEIEYYCNLSALFPNKLLCNLVIESASSTETTDIDECKFALHVLLLFDAFERNYRQFYTLLSESSSDIMMQWCKSTKVIKYKVSDQIRILGSLDRKSIIGSEYSVKDRNSFRFAPSLALTDATVKPSFIVPSNVKKDTRRKVADKILLMASSKSSNFLLVIDTEELLILKPNANDNTVGTILCCMLLNNIIAIASDEEWLHIATKNVEDIGVLIEKGNMVLKFKDVSICQAAKVCISNSRNQWRINMTKSISNFLDSML